MVLWVGGFNDCVRYVSLARATFGRASDARQRVRPTDWCRRSVTSDVRLDCRFQVRSPYIYTALFCPYRLLVPISVRAPDVSRTQWMNPRPERYLRYAQVAFLAESACQLLYEIAFGTIEFHDPDIGEFRVLKP